MTEHPDLELKKFNADLNREGKHRIVLEIKQKSGSYSIQDLLSEADNLVEKQVFDQ